MRSRHVSVKAGDVKAVCGNGTWGCVPFSIASASDLSYTSNSGALHFLLKPPNRRYDYF
jgi:hypothetical protein